MFKKIDKEIFGISIVISAIFVIWTILMPEQAGGIFSTVNSFITDYFGWSYALGMTLFLVFCLFVAFSKFGNIKLGKDEDKPEYSTMTWFFMLFSASMGIGLVFWSIAEPMSFLGTPPWGGAGTAAGAEQAMRYTFFHWGLHPWGVYALVGMALAYFSFRKDMPFLVSSTFAPILGEKGTRGGLGKAIDILAVFATIFGVATSLGLGAMQITTGLSFAYGTPDTLAVTMVVIAVITVLFTVSVVSGINKGIKYLSYVNMALAFTFIAFFLFIGPFRYIMDTFVTTVGYYLFNLPWMSLFVDPYNVVADNVGYDWVGGWTIFYWAWWIAWSPFVGSFIARISRGRTVRELVMGVLIAPVLLSFIWLSAFGGSAMNIELFGIGGIADAVAANVSSAFFVTLSHFPLAGLTTLLATLMITTFFVTSADSATLVTAMLTSGGDPEPDASLRITWGVIKGATAAVLLLAGGLGALQTASIVAAFPFMIVLCFMMYTLYKAFSQERGSLVFESAKEAKAAAAELKESK
ncbi:MAG: glycine/betaine ABC transporter permease [Desulfitibacter sp. BRH_c19]|nr:MAG: glycine/betaine ABC transporter permease [Desulfitibacter sp. BRH_c19]